MTKYAYNEQILVPRILSYVLHAKNNGYNERRYNEMCEYGTNDNHPNKKNVCI